MTEGEAFPGESLLLEAAYARHIEYMLRPSPVLEMLRASQPPVGKWTRRRRRLMTKVRRARQRLGMWIGGIEPHDCWEC